MQPKMRIVNPHVQNLKRCKNSSKTENMQITCLFACLLAFALHFAWPTFFSCAFSFHLAFVIFCTYISSVKHVYKPVVL